VFEKEGLTQQASALESYWDPQLSGIGSALRARQLGTGNREQNC